MAPFFVPNMKPSVVTIAHAIVYLYFLASEIFTYILINNPIIRNVFEKIKEIACPRVHQLQRVVGLIGSF